MLQGMLQNQSILMKAFGDKKACGEKLWFCHQNHEVININLSPAS